jgi:hypothetical protein
MDGRKVAEVHYGILVALTLSGCGHRERISPGEITATREAFEAALIAEFDLANQFDKSTAELRTEDRLDEVSRTLTCRSRNQHLEHLDSLLGSAKFERAFDGKPGRCWTWGRTQDGHSFLASRGWAQVQLPHTYHVIRDVVRVCVELTPVGDTCRTTYHSFAVRLLQAQLDDGYVRLNTPDLANDLGKETIKASRDGIEHWVAKDH